MKTIKNLFLDKKYNGLDNIKAGMEEEQDWVKEIAIKMGTPDRTELAYKALIAVLHSVRDKLDLQQVFHLSAYLPLSIRGIYFEGYDPENVKVIIYNNHLLMSFRNRMGPRNGRYFEDYLDRYGKKKINGHELIETIRDKLKSAKGVNPDLAFQAVMEVMYEKIPVEGLNVHHIKSLMDLDTEFQVQG